jgi:membrane protein DedA with SNARE-associated domain
MQHVIDPIVTFCTSLIGHWGLPAVFVLMLLESACIPIPSEAIMPFAGFAVSQGHMNLAGIVVAGVVGNLCGSWVSYGVGYHGGRPFVERYGRYVLLRAHHLALAERFFARYGPITVFFARMVPIVCTFISLPAGFGRMRFWKFTLYTVMGSVPWVLMLGFVGEKLGSNWERIDPLLHYLDYAVAVAVVALVVWAVLRRRGGSRGAAGDPAGGS